MKKIILLCLLFLVSIPSFAINKISISQVKANVRKMASMGAPMEDIDGYISASGWTVEDVRNYNDKEESKSNQEESFFKKAQDAGFDEIEICKEIQRRGIIDNLDENKKYLCLSILDMEKKAKLSKEDIVKELQEMGYDVGQVSLWDSEWQKLERCEKLKEAGVLDNFSNEHKDRCLTLIKKEKSRKIKSRLVEVFVFVLFILFLWFIIYKAIPKLIYVIRKAWLKAEQDSKK